MNEKSSISPYFFTYKKQKPLQHLQNTLCAVLESQLLQESFCVEFVCSLHIDGWFPLGFSHNLKTYSTGELETVSKCEYECVWWTGHLSRGVSCLWHRKGSSLMTLYRTSTMPLLLSATLFPPPMCLPWSMFPNKIIQKPSIYQKISKKKERKEERKKKKRQKK